MSSGFFYLNQPHHLRIRIRTGFGVLRDVGDRLDRQSFNLSWDLDSLITQGSFTLWVPVQEDDYDLDVWREIRIDDNSLVQSNRYERYLRGFIITLDTWEENGIKYYQCKVVDGNIFFSKSPNMVTYPVEYTEEDLPWDDQYFMSQIVAVCCPGLDFDVTPIRLHHRWIDPETFEPFTLQNSTMGEAVKALQDYMGRNTPPEEQIPQALITWGRDDTFDHVDDDYSWRWKIDWFTWDEIDTFVLKLTDDNVETELNAHYYSFRRTRAGAQMINRQYVVGFDWETGEPIEYTANDTESQDYYGIILSGKPIVSETAATLEEVTAEGEAELEKWKSALETISGLKVLYPYILGSPAKIKIKNANEGGLGDYTEYILSACSMSVNSAGLVEFDLNLGATFPAIGERGAGWRGGARFNRDVKPPRIVSWHSDPAEDIRQNRYDGATHSVTVEVTWPPAPDHDTRDYFVRTRFDGTGTPNQNYSPVPQSGTPSFTIDGLAPNEPAGETHTIEFSVRARDSHGNIQQTWSPWRAVPLAVRDYPAAPTDFTDLSTGVGPEGGFVYLGWSEGGDAHTQHDIWYWPSTNIYDIRRIRLSHPSPLVNMARISGGLTAGLTYGFQIRSVTEWDDVGPWCFPISVEIEYPDPAPPSVFMVDTSVNGVGYGYDSTGAYVGLIWNRPAGTDHFHLVVSDLTGPITRIYRDWQGDPTGLIVTGLPRNVALTYEIASVDAYGYESQTPATFTFTVPNETPAAPTSLTLLNSGISRKNGIEVGWATFSFIPNSGYGGAQYWYRAYNSGTWKMQNMVVNNADDGVHIFRVDGLPVNQGLWFAMRTGSVWGPYTGPWSTAIGPYTISSSIDSDPPAFDTIIDGNDFPAWSTSASSGSPADVSRLVNDGYKGRAAMRFSLTGTQSLTKESSGWSVAPGVGAITLAFRADHLTNTVRSAIIDYYTAAGTLLSGSSSTLTLPALTLTNTWQETEQKVTIPATAAYAKLRLGGSHSVGGTNTMDVSIANWLMRVIGAIALGLASVTAPALGPGAVTAPAIGPAAVTAPALGAGAVTAPAIGPAAITPPALAAAAVKPSAIDTGVLAGLYNGDLEIPNQAGTMADAWDATGPVIWQNTTAMSGVRTLSIGGSAGTAVILSPYFLWTYDDINALALRVRFRAAIQSGGGPAGTKTVKIRFFDSSKVQTGADTSLRTNDDTGSLVMAFSSVQPYMLEGMVPFSYVPSNAVYARIVWSIATTGTGDTGYLDSLQIDTANDSLAVSRVQFRDSGLAATGGAGAGGKLYSTYSQGPNLPTNPIVDDTHRQGADTWGWNGTYWVGPEVPIMVTPYSTALPALGSTTEFLVTSLRGDQRLLITRFTISYYTGGGVSGVNYWRFYLRRLTSGLSVDNLGYIQTTSNNWHKPADLTAFSNNPLNAADVWLQLWAEKTGAPGNVQVAVAVYGRYIHP